MRGGVLGREAGDDVGVDRDAGDRGARPLDDSRVVRREVAPAHPAEHAVVARLERQVEVRQRPRPAVDPRREQLVVDVLRLDGAEADPLHGRLGEDPPHEPGERQRARGVRAARAPLRPAAVVRADVDPRQHDLAVAGGERPAHVREHGSRGELRSAPRARGMMQYVQ